jgi:ankyrin repeat protein
MAENADEIQDTCLPPPDLVIAVCAGEYKRVQRLLRGGADPNTEYKGRPCLHWAAQFGRLSISELLLDYGADVNRSDSDAVTPLHIAIVEGRLRIARLLLKRGADVNHPIKADDGFRPLHNAITWAELPMVKVLLNAGADINGRDEHSRTPLFTCIRFKRLDCAKLLTEFGCDANARDRSGRTALQYGGKTIERALRKLLETASQRSNARPNKRNRCGAGPR